MQAVAIIVSLAVTLVAAALVVKTVLDMTSVMRKGRPVVGRKDQPLKRTTNMLKETVGHTRMLQWTWIGIMHWFVFAGFCFLTTAVLTAYFQLFDAHFALPIIGHWFLFEWVTEFLGVLSSIGIIFLIVYRQLNHPRRKGRKSRFFGSTAWQAYFVEVMALIEGAAPLFIRGAEYKLHSDATKFHYPVSWMLSGLFGDGEKGLENAIYAIAAFKILFAMIWIIVIARNITMGVAWHRFTVWFNVWFKRESSGRTALGGLQPIMIKGEPLDLEKMEDLEEEDFEKLGVGKVEEFTWKGILDMTTCTECGRCQSQCPAWNTEKPLSPKLLMMGLRDHAYAKIPLLDVDEADLTEEHQKTLERPLIGDESMFGVIDPDVLWSCTNCGACVQQCPVDIEHVDHIDDMRRFQVLVESNFPAELNNIFKGLERKGNPWGMDPKGRMDWAKNLDFEVKQVGVDVESLDEVDWLFWVGCAGAFEDRAKKTTQAVAELLNTAGVSFAVLGDGETCTGDPARRAGNEIVFMQLAMENAEVFKETKVKKVVSTCAHCFNTLKNEYKEFGVELEVVHHTQLLNRLVREGKLKPVAPAESTTAGKTITYHDPCFLGRHNQVYEPPRELLNVIPGATFTEMPRNSERSFCCGAGGARMWMEETLGSRINVNRTEEAVATGADQIAVGCPFCRVMLSDGLTAKQAAGEAREEVEVLDVAQLLLAGVKRREVVEEAESITAAAAEAEPDAADKADDDSISETDEVGPAAEAHTEGEATTGDTPSDAEAAAEHDVKVDDKGDAKATEESADTGPAVSPGKVEEAVADDSGDDSDDASSEDDVPEGLRGGPVVGAEAAEAPAEEPEAEPDATDEVEQPPASDVPNADEGDPEDAEPVTSVEPAEESTSDDDAAPAEEVTAVPDESEPVQEDEREEEAAAETEDEAPEQPTAKAENGQSAKTEPAAEVQSVDEVETTADPVSDDAAPLTDPSPSATEVSDAATKAAEDDDTSK